MFVTIAEKGREVAHAVRIAHTDDAIEESGPARPD
jgi:hypothetical protein